MGASLVIAPGQLRRLDNVDSASNALQLLGIGRSGKGQLTEKSPPRLPSRRRLRAPVLPNPAPLGRSAPEMASGRAPGVLAGATEVRAVVVHVSASARAEARFQIPSAAYSGRRS